jgi:membrane protein YqaA with SNARE-associated domain
MPPLEGCALTEDAEPKSPTGVTDEMIRQEIRVHWTARLMRPVRRMYEWILHWAETKYGGVALAVVAWSEAVFFPMPADPILIALCLGKPKRSYWYAVSCTFWSTFGAMCSFFAGALIGKDRFLEAMAWLDLHEAWIGLHFEKNVQWALDQYSEMGFWAIAAGALLSFVPYKFFSWTAGFAGIPWYTFLLGTVIFRKFRYVLMGMLIYIYGERARRFIDKYFNKICAVVGIVIVLALVLLKYRTAIWEFFSGSPGG